MRALSNDRRFNAGLVLHRPTPAELQQRQPFALTQRDRSILSAVYTFGFLTTDQIELAFFPPTGQERQSPSSCAYDRLRQLWLWEYLQRVELPHTRADGRLPYLYTLGQQGVSVVQQHVQGVVHTRRIDHLTAQFVDHDLQAASLWANLAHYRRQVLAVPITGCRWWGECELRAKRLQVWDRDHDRRLAFLPDGLVKLTYADGRTQLAAVEIDRSSLTAYRFRRKLEAFEQFVATGRAERVFGSDDLDVWILAPSQKRLKTLLGAVQAVVDAERQDRYLLTTFATLQPERFCDQDAEAWIDGTGETYGSPLLEPLSDEDEGAADDEDGDG